MNVGFIGCGRIADLHVLGYQERTDARLYAVCDARPEEAERRKTEWGVEKAYTDYRELLADPHVDAVEVLTPYDTHERVVIDALQAGKHVACQKPLTTSLASAERILAAAREADGLFKVTECYVTYPPIALAKQFLDEKLVGNPVGMRIKYVVSPKGGWFVPPTTYEQQFRIAARGHGFETFDHGHHEWAVGWHILGDVERVAAWVDTRDGIVDAPATVMWKARDGKRYGVCDFMHADDMDIPTKYYPNDEWFEITCERGIILVNRGTGMISDRPAVSVFDGSGWTHHDDMPKDWADGFKHSTFDFIDAVHGKKEPLLSGPQALEVLRFALAVETSASKRREVFLDEMQCPLPGLYNWLRRRRERKEVIVGPRPWRLDLFGGNTAKYAPKAVELTEQLAERFDASKAEGWDCVIGVDVTPEGGGAGEKFGFRVSNGEFTLTRGELPEDAVLTLRIPAGTWAAILMNKKRIETAFLQGKIRYEGRAEEGLRLKSVFGL